MQNDAKLGLLAGVVGVVIAATLPGKSTPPTVGAAANPASSTVPQSSPAHKPTNANDIAPAAVPAESDSTPVKRKNALAE